MFGSFDASPCILRLWGKAHVYENGSRSFAHWMGKAFNPTSPAGTPSVWAASAALNQRYEHSKPMSLPHVELKEIPPLDSITKPLMDQAIIGL